MTFSEKFDLLRRRHGVTMRDIADALGSGVGTVGGWARGAVPRPEMGRRLAAFFDVSVDDLFDDSRDIPPDRAAARIAAAKAVAEAVPVDQPQLRQATFERHVERGAFAVMLRHQATVLRERSANMHGHAQDLAMDADKLEALALQFDAASPPRDPDGDNQKALEIAERMNAEREKRLARAGLKHPPRESTG